MISFKDYLKQNKGQLAGGVPEVAKRFNSIGVAINPNTTSDEAPANDQSVGDVTGGMISGGENEEVSPKNSNNEPESELELNDNPSATEEPDEDALELQGEDELEAGEAGDPNKQGITRVVKGAHLVSKRESEEGGFEELWMYEIKKSSNDEFDVRNSILAATDIPKNQTQTPDGTQRYTLWTAGNMQLMKITGLVQ